MCAILLLFAVGGVQLNYVSEFKYLDHTITDKLSDDDINLKCVCCLSEQKFYYVVTGNVHSASPYTLSIILYVFYDISLWNTYLTTLFKKLGQVMSSVTLSPFLNLVDVIELDADS